MLRSLATSTASVSAIEAAAVTATVEELIQVIGVEATLQLCDRLGGLALPIGAPSETFISAIGRDAAEKLRKHCTVGRLYIPRRTLSTRARHDKVRQLAREGATRQQIALRVGLSERQVYKVLARAST